MSKHTPGPWYVEFEEYGGYDCMYSAYRVTSPNKQSEFYNDTVAEVDTGFYHQDINNVHSENEEARANAHLIAAAPDMKEALLEAIEWDGFDSHDEPAVWLEKAMSALAKERGEV